MTKSRHKGIEPILAEVIKTVAPKIGARVVFEPKWGIVGCIVYKSGRRRYFRNSTLDINRMGASEISRDKGYSKYFINLLGYPVVEGSVFYSKQWCRAIGSKKDINHAYKYARKLGFPVFIKPNSKSRGLGVAKVFTRSEFYQAMRQAFLRDQVALVERAINEASDYRIVVLDRRVISAYQRIPLSVIGDGRSTIEFSLDQKAAGIRKNWPGYQNKAERYSFTDQAEALWPKPQFGFRDGSAVFSARQCESVIWRRIERCHSNDSSRFSTVGDPIDL